MLSYLLLRQDSIELVKLKRDEIKQELDERCPLAMLCFSVAQTAQCYRKLVTDNKSLQIMTLTKQLRETTQKLDQAVRLSCLLSTHQVTKA